MKRVELYGRVRHAVMIEGLSQREAARCFGIDPRTVRKMLSYSVPPGYVRTRPPVRPKLDPFIGIIDRILEEDKDRPKKQRHTSKRIFERHFQHHFLSYSGFSLSTRLAPYIWRKPDGAMGSSALIAMHREIRSGSGGARHRRRYRRPT